MFLENVYGALFYPSETFERLKQNTNLIISLAIVIAISIISPLLNVANLNAWSFFNIISAAFSGIIKWAFFAFFIEMIASIFKRGGRLEVFLTLSAFALLPWIFMGPIALFKTGGLLTGIIGVLAGLGVWIWTTILTLFAIIKAYDLSSERILLFIFVPVLGGIVFLDWLVGFFSTLARIVMV